MHRLRDGLLAFGVGIVVAVCFLNYERPTRISYSIKAECVAEPKRERPKTRLV